MPYAPIKRRDFEKRLKELGWHLEKGSIDWKLYDERDKFVCAIKITHPGNEIIPMHLQKVKKICQERGLSWDKKSQKRS